jgi:hypothetical protein
MSSQFFCEAHIWSQFFCEAHMWSQLFSAARAVKPLNFETGGVSSASDEIYKSDF